MTLSIDTFPDHSLTVLVWIVLGSPFLAFVLQSFLGEKLPRKGDWLSLSCNAVSFAAALLLSLNVFSGSAEQVLRYSFTWVQAGSLHIQAGYYLDSLSLIMLVLVTFIALLVHLYSIGYMKGDPRYHRYWAYLSLFLAAMLGVVASGNLLVTYMCWELVGLASYLMIGFWLERDKAVQAGKKAFIINRIGDLGFLTGLMALFSLTGTFDIPALNQYMPGEGTGGPGWLVYLAAGGLALGAFAKSAQFPLHTWLPDAMEGPTSISALIHAATMVAAGVFLLARLHPLFPEEVLSVIAVLGTLTAFLAASVALVQYDIKKVLAWSTISQLGYMMLGIGTGSYQGAIFHLVTHAFFKCLLFLAAGFIIHQMHELKHRRGLDIDEQDMRHMGGLRKHLPLTFTVYTLGAAALVGLPFFSGFLSKEMILLEAFHWSTAKGGAWNLVPVAATFTALLTAWYIGRQWSLVFWGKPRTGQPAAGPGRVNDPGEFDPLAWPEGLKETGWSMKLPMILLALFTVFAWFSLNPFHAEDAPLVRALTVTAAEPALELPDPAPGGAARWIGGSLLVVSGLLVPLVLAGSCRKYAGPAPFTPPARQHPVAKFLYEGWYIDKIYNRIFTRPVMKLAEAARFSDRKIIDGLIHTLAGFGVGLSKFIAWTDKYLVDGFFRWMAARVRSAGDFFRGFQTGSVQQYFALAMLGLILLFLVTLFMI